MLKCVYVSRRTTKCGSVNLLIHRVKGKLSMAEFKLTILVTVLAHCYRALTHCVVHKHNAILVTVLAHCYSALTHCVVHKHNAILVTVHEHVMNKPLHSIVYLGIVPLYQLWHTAQWRVNHFSLRLQYLQ